MCRAREGGGIHAEVNWEKKEGQLVASSGSLARQKREKSSS